MWERLELLYDLRGALAKFTTNKELTPYLLVVRPKSMIEDDPFEDRMEEILASMKGDIVNNKD